MNWKKLIMSHTGPGHLIGMGVIAAVLVMVFVLFGQSLRQALPYAATLACPLMMIVMMFGMRGGHHGHDGHDDHGHDHAGHDEGLPGRATGSSSNLR